MGRETRRDPDGIRSWFAPKSNSFQVAKIIKASLFSITRRPLLLSPTFPFSFFHFLLWNNQKALRWTDDVHNLKLLEKIRIERRRRRRRRKDISYPEESETQVHKKWESLYTRVKREFTSQNWINRKAWRRSQEDPSGVDGRSREWLARSYPAGQHFFRLFFFAEVEGYLS